MKSQLNREFIESLNESSNQEFSKNLIDSVYGLVEKTLNDISEKSPFVKVDQCVIVPVNEIYLGSYCQLSQYSFFLGIDNPQIAFNSKKRKNWWAYIWREFKSSWRIGRKKKYKKEVRKEPATFDKYRISDFKHDIFLKFANNISETSMVYEYPFNVSLVGSDDFGLGVKINVYVCYFDSKTNTFKLYLERKNKFIDINFENRFENLNKKFEKCGEVFVDTARLINTIFAKKYNAIPNQIIVESLLYSCPDILFKANDIYQTFVNVSNYIRIMDPKAFTSICNDKVSLFDDKIILKSKSQIDFSKIVAMLDEYKY